MREPGVWIRQGKKLKRIRIQKYFWMKGCENMDWKKELKERLGIMDEIAAAGLDDMDGYEVLGEQHLFNLNGRASRGQDISKGFFQAVRELNS